MKNILILEFKNCIANVKFKIVLMVLLLMSILGYLVNCYSSYKLPLSQVRGAYEVSLIQGIQSSNILGIMIVFIPLLSNIVYSDSYYVDSHTGVYKNIITRVNKRHYIISKAIVILTVTFFVFFIPLLLNQLLCLITYPVEGIDHNYCFPAYDIGYQNYTANWLFELTRFNNPFLYNVIYMIIISIFASLFGLIGYIISLIYNKKRFIIVIAPFILNIVIEIFIDILGRIFNFESYRYVISTFFRPSTASIYVLLFYIITILIINILILTKNSNNETII
ncbi:hypothetical protein ACJDU8_00545 [Clostridium sp. WILCCON 0269]|uniref:ABC transporter permease n=1 Tax=Candidatus Clostridium eludens TaxID=3381663 RepID=A0ABW8SDY1_9CLOT